MPISRIEELSIRERERLETLGITKVIKIEDLSPEFCDFKDKSEVSKFKQEQKKIKDPKLIIDFPIGDYRELLRKEGIKTTLKYGEDSYTIKFDEINEVNFDLIDFFNFARKDGIVNTCSRFGITVTITDEKGVDCTSMEVFNKGRESKEQPEQQTSKPKSLAALFGVKVKSGTTDKSLTRPRLTQLKNVRRGGLSLFTSSKVR